MRILKRIFFIMIIILTLYTNNKTNAYESKEYYINNEQDLWNFSEMVNNGDTFEETTVYLNVDIDLKCNENKQWIPIGNCNAESGNNAETTTDKNPFGGIFEGNNHNISGIYIDSEENYRGVFGYNQGTIKNVTVKESYIKSKKAYIGGICAYNKGTIENCHNYANIFTDTLAGACGGIAGYCTGAKIKGCSNSGKIEGENGFIGGIVGYSWGTEIQECFNIGDIETDAHGAAGIVAYCQTSWLRDCYNVRKYNGCKLYWRNNCCFV